MKNNYPIKYALMPIYEQVGWSHGLNQLERNYQVVTYIVSKCYVISQTKRYLRNGKSKEEYEVVFPFEKEDYPDWVRVGPEFNVASKSVNSQIIDSVFETFEDANIAKNELNECLLEEKGTYLPFDEHFFEKIENLKIENNELIAKYQVLESEVDENTKDLEINRKNKEQSVIVIAENRVRIINYSLYQLIELFDEKPFVVLNVTEEEFDLMKGQVKKEGKLEDVDYSKFSYLMINNPDEEIIRIVDSKQENGSFYLSDGRLYFDKNMTSFQKDISQDYIPDCMIVYTTETFEDVITSYFVENSHVEEIESEKGKIKNRIKLRF